MGIDVNKNIAISVGISSMLCGWIGMLVIPLFSINASMSGTIAMKGFSAGVVGGFGTMGGAVVGGLLIGIIENLYVLIGPSTYKDVVSFVILICFLIINPGGIAGLVSKKEKAECHSDCQRLLSGKGRKIMRKQVRKVCYCIFY